MWIELNRSCQFLWHIYKWYILLVHRWSQTSQDNISVNLLIDHECKHFLCTSLYLCDLMRVHEQLIKLVRLKAMFLLFAFIECHKIITVDIIMSKICLLNRFVNLSKRTTITNVSRETIFLCLRYRLNYIDDKVCPCFTWNTQFITQLPICGWLMSPL